LQWRCRDLQLPLHGIASLLQRRCGLSTIDVQKIYGGVVAASMTKMELGHFNIRVLNILKIKVS